MRPSKLHYYILKMKQHLLLTFIISKDIFSLISLTDKFYSSR